MLDCTCTKQITSMNLVPMNYELLDIQLIVDGHFFFAPVAKYHIESHCL